MLLQFDTEYSQFAQLNFIEDLVNCYPSMKLRGLNFPFEMVKEQLKQQKNTGLAQHIASKFHVLQMDEF